MENNKSLAQTIAQAIYILYLAAILVPPLAIIGVIFSYVFENDGEDFLKSHYTYLIRSFWIGLLFFAVSGLLIPVMIGIVLTLLTLIWWLIRVIKGFKYLLQYKPILNPKTWKF